MTTYRFHALLVPVALALIGCGGRGELSGTVTYEGKTVRSGSVLVVGTDGIPKSSPIKPDGTYHITDIATGEVKIAVNSPDPGEVRYIPRKKDDKPPPPGDRSKWFYIPTKYSDFNKSELTFTVGRGPNKFDIPLK